MSNEVEQRLQRAFAAVAEVVDERLADAGPVAGPRARPSARRVVPWKPLAAAVAVGAVGLGVALAVILDTAEPPARATTLPAPPPTIVSVVPLRSFPFDLYTHCGIRGAFIDGVYFTADEPPAGPGANPPPG